MRPSRTLAAYALIALGVLYLFWRLQHFIPEGGVFA